jgi:tocopherol cyclase
MRRFLRIGPNHFMAEYLALDIQSPQLTARGELHFSSLTAWPVTLISPGIMGWYAWVPFMECYHGVVSLDHPIEGTLKIDDQAIDFSGGRGYIEKDWGQSFPAAWIWFQTNHFERVGTSLTASVAIISWVRRSFPGFIIGLWHDGALYRFATYTGARIERLDITDERIVWIVRDSHYRLEMEAVRTEGGLLQAPTSVDMGRRIAETLSATVQVSLYKDSDRASQLIVHDTGRHASLEAVGDLETLRAMRASQAQADGG